MNNIVEREIMDRLDTIEEKIGSINKFMSSLKIDHQTFLKSNNPIIPGIGCKVAFDKNGLILRSMDLESSDIPSIPIDKIDGLRDLLSDKINNSDIKRLKDSLIDVLVSSNNIKEGYGINIIRDNNDVTISIDLIDSDIPILPIRHIDGLREKLELIESSLNDIPKEFNIDDFKVEPGTFPKVTYDSKGRIVSGSKLSVDDIPNEFISRINVLESNITLLSSQKYVDNVSKSINKKIDGNDPITPGIYTKVKVDSKGLITSGDKLSINDLPKLSTSNIDGLDQILQNKVNYDQYIDLNDSVSSLHNAINKLGEVSKLRNILDSKANDKDLKELDNKVIHLQELMDVLSNKIPNELIMEQLSEIQKELSNLSGRISVLENKVLNI